jgi:hypothetical protein
VTAWGWRPGALRGVVFQVSSPLRVPLVEAGSSLRQWHRGVNLYKGGVSWGVLCRLGQGPAEWQWKLCLWLPGLRWGLCPHALLSQRSLHGAIWTSSIQDRELTKPLFSLKLACLGYFVTAVKNRLTQWCWGLASPVLGLPASLLPHRSADLGFVPQLRMLPMDQATPSLAVPPVLCDVED